MIANSKVNLAAKLYSCRNNAKKIYKDAYEKKIGPYKLKIRSMMQQYNLRNEMDAAVKLIATVKDRRCVKITTMHILIAAIELIESRLD